MTVMWLNFKRKLPLIQTLRSIALVDLFVTPINFIVQYVMATPVLCCSDNCFCVYEVEFIRTEYRLHIDPAPHYDTSHHVSMKFL